MRELFVRVHSLLASMCRCGADAALRLEMIGWLIWPDRGQARSYRYSARLWPVGTLCQTPETQKPRVVGAFVENSGGSVEIRTLG